MTERKITKRDHFEAVKAYFEAYDVMVAEDISSEDVITFCENEIDLLDKKAAKAKERAAVKAKEGDELTAAVEAVLNTDEFQTIADIAAQIEGEDVTIAKVQWRLGQLVKNGVAEKSEVSVPGVDGGKARKLVAYKLIAE